MKMNLYGKHICIWMILSRFENEAKGTSEMAYSNNKFDWQTQFQLGELKNWT